MEGFQDVSGLMGCAIYALKRRGTVVYIGQTRAAVQRLYTHYNNLQKRGRKGIKWISFDEMWIMPCAYGDLDRVEAELIQRWRPKHNVRVPEVPIDIRALVASLVPIRVEEHPMCKGTIRRL